MMDCVWNTRVRKHNLRGSEKQTEHDSSGIVLVVVYELLIE